MDDEYEDDEIYEDRGESPFDSTVDYPDDSEEADEGAEYVSEYAGVHRAMLLLILVLVIGIVLLGLFIVIRPAPVVVPTMKPPWLV